MGDYNMGDYDMGYYNMGDYNVPGPDRTRLTQMSGLKAPPNCCRPTVDSPQAEA